jgi:hypothetical protein
VGGESLLAARRGEGCEGWGARLDRDGRGFRGIGKGGEGGFTLRGQLSAISFQAGGLRTGRADPVRARAVRELRDGDAVVRR